ncbi:MAG: SDR family NAD(P)-dependent oxidoreductase [Acidimicrobiales bacterium]|jgi:NAD(P)-dependent dehydrogenase (short-subunit alcohol dehydrogenase family)|nr:SDR family NAD(P)-dependent oxidoreductase [Acidimicrobiales bacterium]
MSIDLEDQVAIVTGAGGGIGRATALELARLGAAVVVNDLGTSTRGEGSDATKAESVADEISAAGGRAAVSGDSVAEFEAAGRIVDTALTAFGRVDILVNNAGLTAPGNIKSLDPDDFERISASHIKGTFNCARHAVPHMIEAGGGRIVNLVSRAGILGIPGSVAYGVGKGGVFGFTNVASRELARHGITVNAVNPASTETRMVTQATDQMRRGDAEMQARGAALLAAAQSPEQVAVLIAWLCTPAAADVSGQVFLVSKNNVGLFQPLTITQNVDRDEAWTVADLGDALGGLSYHPLDQPYG